MADINEVNGVYGGVEFGPVEAQGEQANNGEEVNNITTNSQSNLPAKPGLWARFKGFLFQEIRWNEPINVELTPYQQKVEDEINEFLHQEITWEKVHDFLFQDVTFGKKKNA